MHIVSTKLYWTLKLHVGDQCSDGNQHCSIVRIWHQPHISQCKRGSIFSGPHLLPQFMTIHKGIEPFWLVRW
ncbi:hypothetical protein KCU59_g170, partial [Aureobasidium melanogenum]